MIYEILHSAHRLSDSRWRLIFSLPISTFSALGVSHVMRSINVYDTYLLTYLVKCKNLNKNVQRILTNFKNTSRELPVCGFRCCRSAPKCCLNTRCSRSTCIILRSFTTRRLRLSGTGLSWSSSSTRPSSRPTSPPSCSTMNITFARCASPPFCSQLRVVSSST